MWAAGRLVLLIGLALLLASSTGTAQLFRGSGRGSKGSPAKPTTSETGKDEKKPQETVRIGALLPLSGVSEWYGKEMRQGIELAIAELNRQRRAIPPADDPDAFPGEEQKATDAAQRANAEGLPSPGVQLVLEALDVPPLNAKQATDHFARLAAAQPPVVFTASATPTLAIYPSSASRDVLLVHQGVVSGRFPAQSRTLLHTRPSLASRIDRLAAYAWVRGLRRLALLAAGDEFGKTVRARLPERWRDVGGVVVHVESVSLDAPDLRSRLRQLGRLQPDAVVLAFRGPDLGDLAARLREAGYTGLLLGADDDPSALLAAGPALDNAVVLAEAFVPEPRTLGERFATAYKTKFGRPPSHFAANAYEAIAIIADGIRLAREEGRGTPGGTRLFETLRVQRVFPSVYGGEVRLRGDGTLERRMGLFRVDGGELVFTHYIEMDGETVEVPKEPPAQASDGAASTDLPAWASPTGEPD